MRRCERGCALTPASIRGECLNINSFWSLTQGRVIISAWQLDYNYRPHSALGYQPPAH